MLYTHAIYTCCMHACNLHKGMLTVCTAALWTSCCCMSVSSCHVIVAVWLTEADMPLKMFKLCNGLVMLPQLKLDPCCSLLCTMQTDASKPYNRPVDHAC